MRGEDFHRRLECRLREHVRVSPKKQWTADACCQTVLADRLRDCEDVPLVERAGEGAAAVSGRPELDALGQVGGVGTSQRKRSHERSQIHEGARIEILDTQGRRVWSSGLVPELGPVAWSGEREAGGRARPGIYFARVTDAGGVTTARFSWLGGR